MATAARLRAPAVAMVAAALRGAAKPKRAWKGGTGGTWRYDTSPARRGLGGCGHGRDTAWRQSYGTSMARTGAAEASRVRGERAGSGAATMGHGGRRDVPGDGVRVMAMVVAAVAGTVGLRGSSEREANGGGHGAPGRLR